MSRKVIAPFRFRVRPDGNALYYLVYVHPSKAEMQRWNINAERQYGETPPEGDDYAARVRSLRKYVKGKTTPLVGEIHFAEGLLTMRIISHEAAHAAHYWYMRKFKTHTVDLFETDADEIIASATGDIASDIVAGLKRLKFIE